MLKRKAVKNVESERTVQKGEILDSLAYLKITIEDVIEFHRRKQGARIHLIEDYLKSAGRLKRGEGKGKRGALEQQILKELSELDIKPGKGRAKDVVKLERLTGRIIEKLPDLK